MLNRPVPHIDVIGMRTEKLKDTIRERMLEQHDTRSIFHESSARDGGGVVDCVLAVTSEMTAVQVAFRDWWLEPSPERRAALRFAAASAAASVDRLTDLLGPAL